MIQRFIIKKLKTNGLVITLNKEVLMQEEEVISVSEILSSIRQTLSKEAAKLNVEPVVSDGISSSNQTSAPSKIMPPVFHHQDVVLELTPQMRVETESFANNRVVNDKMDGFLNSSRGSNHYMVQSDVQQMTKAWLEQNLPSIVEKVVSQEVKRLFSGK